MIEIIRPAHTKEFRDNKFYEGLKLNKSINSIHTNTPILAKRIEDNKEFIIYEYNTLGRGTYDLYFLNIDKLICLTPVDGVNACFNIYEYKRQGFIYVDEGHVSENKLSKKGFLSYIEIRSDLRAGSNGNNTIRIIDSNLILKILNITERNKIIYEGSGITGFILYPLNNIGKSLLNIEDFGGWGVSNKWDVFISYENTFDKPLNICEVIYLMVDIIGSELKER